MAKPNYSFEKRQKELARKKKKEEKREHKAPPEEFQADKPASMPAAPAMPADLQVTNSDQ